MPCQLLARTRALFSSSSTRRRCQYGDPVSDDEKAALFQEERELLVEGTQDQEKPFPCSAFINTASQYILPQTSSHQYQYVPTPRTSSFSSSNHQSCLSSSSTYQHSAITIDPTPLAHAFANLAVDAGIYGTRDSYVEVLAFQLRRMVRSLAGQCSDSKDGCLTLQVTRPELNCTVHITIQTRRRTRTHHSVLSPFNRVEDEQIVILALKPLVAPVEVQSGFEQCQAAEVGYGEPEGVFSTWWVKESRFSCSGSRTGQVRWRCSVVRGRDAWWDLHDIFLEKKATLGSGCGKERWEGEEVEKRRGDDWESGNGGKGRRARCSRMEILRDENGGYRFSCERVRGPR